MHMQVVLSSSDILQIQIWTKKDLILLGIDLVCEMGSLFCFSIWFRQTENYTFALL